MLTLKQIADRDIFAKVQGKYPVGLDAWKCRHTIVSPTFTA